MSEWLLIMWVTTANTFTIAVGTESLKQCEQVYAELGHKFVHADHVCMKRPPAFSRALALSNKTHSQV